MSHLFEDIVFGPIKSRRFGTSLGINLLPTNNKVCNFNCIYCECGWTDLRQSRVLYTPKEVILNSITAKFKVLSGENHSIDSITFAGNGEPTMHPDFLEIIEETVKLRARYFPSTPITVLSNAALLGNKKVMKGLMYADNRVLKLDAGNTKMLNLINIPLSDRKIEWYIDKLKSFNGKVSIQTIFLKGFYNNVYIDNTKTEELDSWLKALKEISPEKVLIYTIDRDTPAKELEKIPAEILQQICNKVNSIGIQANFYL